MFVSATPAEYELNLAKSNIFEQIARPTGLIDPKIEVRKAKDQVDDLFEEIRIRQERNERVLVTTLTKRMAEDLTEYYSDLGLRVQYLHSDISTLERMDIIRDLRIGKFDVLIGINLLREGLDIPEVSLVAILDADKEGFLRSNRSLIQTCGRAARNIRGRVIMYADHVTRSMQMALEETGRRRDIQQDYNDTNHITPATVEKEVSSVFDSIYEADYVTVDEKPFLYCSVQVSYPRFPDEANVQRIVPVVVPLMEWEGNEDPQLACVYPDGTVASIPTGKIGESRHLAGAHFVARKGTSEALIGFPPPAMGTCCFAVERNGSTYRIDALPYSHMHPEDAHMMTDSREVFSFFLGSRYEGQSPSFSPVERRQLPSYWWG